MNILSLLFHPSCGKFLVFTIRLPDLSFDSKYNSNPIYLCHFFNRLLKFGNAHAPYSKFKVGAAIRSASGKIFVGCNVENVAYPEGTCAEAGAIAAMVAGGETSIEEICIVAESPVPVSPCGGCRQKIAEFSQPDTLRSIAGLDGETYKNTLANFTGFFSNLTLPKE